MKNKYIVESLVSLLKGYKSVTKEEPEGAQRNKDLSGIVYLIGQTIRQYKSPASNIHVSVKAYDLWNKITNMSMDICDYREPICCDKIKEGETVECKTYVGSKKEGKTRFLHTNETVVFNAIFHAEHVVPVKVIRDELLALPEIEEASVIAILNKMHIAKILKEEDRNLARTAGRTSDFEQNIRDFYMEKNIEFVELK